MRTPIAFRIQGFIDELVSMRGLAQELDASHRQAQIDRLTQACDLAELHIENLLYQFRREQYVLEDQPPPNRRGRATNVPKK